MEATSSRLKDLHTLRENLEQDLHKIDEAMRKLREAMCDLHDSRFKTDNALAIAETELDRITRQ